MDDYENQLNRNLEIMEKVEKDLGRFRHDSVLCLTAGSTIICVWVLIVALWEKLGRPMPEKYMTYGVEIIAIIMMHIILNHTDIKLTSFGVTDKNMKRAVIRGLIISAVLGAVMVGVKLMMGREGALFDFSRISVVYIATSILQEFLARGVFLNCLLRVYTGKHGRLMAVVGSSLMFSTLHLYYGFSFMCLAGALSLVLGYIYLYDDNIWGVSIVHFFLGAFAFVLGFV